MENYKNAHLVTATVLHGRKPMNRTFMCMGPCIVRCEYHISNQQDATFFPSLSIATLYMFRASLAHRQELRNCVCSLWYWHVDLCDDWYE